MSVGTVTFNCEICGLITERVPLERPTLILLGCSDPETSKAVSGTGRDMHALEAHADVLLGAS